MIIEEIREFLSSKDIKVLMTEFNCTRDFARKVCYRGTRTNHKMLSRALDLAIENKKNQKQKEAELQQKLKLLKQA